MGPKKCLGILRCPLKTVPIKQVLLQGFHSSSISSVLVKNAPYVKVGAIKGARYIEVPLH